MALKTKKEFGELVGIKTKDLSNYIKRGKVKIAPRSRGKIDDTDPINADFIAIQNDKKQAKKEEKTPLKKATKKKSKPAEAPPPSSETPDDSGESLHSLEKKKKALDILKIKEDIELLRVKKQKMYGELIPTDLVKPLVIQVSKSLTVTFKNSWEAKLTMMAKRHKIKKADLAAYKGDMIEEINKAMKSGIEDAKAGVKKIVRAYSETRGKGERK